MVSWVAKQLSYWGVHFVSACSPPIPVCYSSNYRKHNISFENGLKQLYTIDGGAQTDVLYSMREGQFGRYAKTFVATVHTHPIHMATFILD